MTIYRIVLVPLTGKFVGITDEAGQPIDVEDVDGMEWLADGDHEALQIDTDKLT